MTALSPKKEEGTQGRAEAKCTVATAHTRTLTRAPSKFQAEFPASESMGYHGNKSGSALVVSGPHRETGSSMGMGLATVPVHGRGPQIAVHLSQ